jgi:hypothetical protein
MIASAMMQRAELPVVRNRTLDGRSVMPERLQLNLTAQGLDVAKDVGEPCFGHDAFLR